LSSLTAKTTTGKDTFLTEAEITEIEE